jgi:PAS domain-containing protein
MGDALRALAGPAQLLAPELPKRAFDASPEGLALAEDQRILYENPFFGELFGYSRPSKVLGKTLASFRPENALCAEVNCPDPAPTSRGDRPCWSTGRGKSRGAVPVEPSCGLFHTEDREFVIVNVRDRSQGERRRANSVTSFSSLETVRKHSAWRKPIAA